MNSGGNTSIWADLTSQSISVAELTEWVTMPSCGAVVVFTGTARDHSVGRPGVTRLEYEAYESQAKPRLAAVAQGALDRWPDVARIAVVHRTGEIAVGEAAVVVAVSSPHRGDAFEAAQFTIDTLKTAVPIWKREEWDGGKSWGLEPNSITPIENT